MNENQLRKIFILFICGICLVIMAPYLFTRSLRLVSFKDTGTIGDTIGGITAPITSLLGSVLVFYALKAQIEANRLIQYQFDQQRVDEIERKKLLYIAEQINLVRNDINDFSYNYKETEHLTSGDRQIYHVNLKGTDAISKYVDNIKHYGEGHRDEDPFVRNPKLIELYNLLGTIDGLLDKINIENITVEDKAYFKSSIAYQFNLKIKPPFTANEKHRTRNTEPCKKCGKRHFGIPDKIFDLIDILSEKLK